MPALVDRPDDAVLFEVGRNLSAPACARYSRELELVSLDGKDDVLRAVVGTDIFVLRAQQIELQPAHDVFEIGRTQTAEPKRFDFYEITGPLVVRRGIHAHECHFT